MARFILTPTIRGYLNHTSNFNVLVCKGGGRLQFLWRPLVSLHSLLYETQWYLYKYNWLVRIWKLISVKKNNWWRTFFVFSLIRQLYFLQAILQCFTVSSINRNNKARSMPYKQYSHRREQLFRVLYKAQLRDNWNQF